MGIDLVNRVIFGRNDTATINLDWAVSPDFSAALAECEICERAAGDADFADNLPTTDPLQEPGVPNPGPVLPGPSQPQIPGIPVATCFGRLVTVDLSRGQQPTDGDDVILGTPDRDIIEAGGGDDIVCAGGGDDIVQGGAGDDRLVGGGSNDVLVGEGGNDALEGGIGDDDICLGGAGQNVSGPGCEVARQITARIDVPILRDQGRLPDFIPRIPPTVIPSIPQVPA